MPEISISLAFIMAQQEIAFNIASTPLILSTHILIATAAAKPFFGAHPAIILATAIVSHFLSDAIPHWDYHLATMDKKEHSGNLEQVTNFTKDAIAEDLLKISTDILIGSFFAILLLNYSNEEFSFFSATLAIAGAILPDAIQPIFAIWKKNNPFRGLQNFHEFIHAKMKLGRYDWTEKKFVIIGIISQLMICLVAASFILKS